MFTANMDGCSFGYGSKTGTGEVLVSHANADGVGAQAEAAALQSNPSPDMALLKGRAAQMVRQAEMLEKKMQPGTLRTLSPTDYGDPFHGGVEGDPDVYKYAATVVGLRENGSWRFLCQRRVITTSGQYVLRDVIDI
jgi:hypothetical protein